MTPVSTMIPDFQIEEILNAVAPHRTWLKNALFVGKRIVNRRNESGGFIGLREEMNSDNQEWLSGTTRAEVCPFIHNGVVEHYYLILEVIAEKKRINALVYFTQASDAQTRELNLPRAYERTSKTFPTELNLLHWKQWESTPK